MAYGIFFSLENQKILNFTIQVRKGNYITIVKYCSFFENINLKYFANELLMKFDAQRFS